MHEDAFMPPSAEEMLRKSWKRGCSVVIIKTKKRGEELTLADFLNSIVIGNIDLGLPSIDVERGETVAITVMLPKPKDIDLAISELEEFLHDVFMNERSEFSNTEKALMHATDGAGMLEKIYQTERGFGDIKIEKDKVRISITYRTFLGVDVEPL
jgi:hypothetical protein